MIIMIRRIKYIGDISPTIVRFFGNNIEMRTNDIIDLTDEDANKVLENYNFVEVDGKDIKQEVKKESIKSKEITNLDINNDGIVDKKDRTLAAKVLASGNRK